jgi:4-amino-4-deoxy-L-arabinose transferase-like glycosyltransferase
MYRLFIYEDYHYGYPFYALSALVLLVPRLVFGGSFAGHTRINLLLLRQMASVLPMILSIFVLVYIVTRFKSWARAVSMFVVLLLIPGVVKYNERFWHPDSLLLLFIVLTFYFLQRDRLRFGRNFYLAAVTCGLATATKLYGFFFFLAVGGYLLAGLVYRVLGFRKMILAGLLFVLTMSVTVLLANPFLIDSEARARMVAIMQDKNAEMAHGYNEPDLQHIYRTGLEVWMPFFEQHYTQGYFFFFLFLALAAGSLWGSETHLNVCC